MPRKNFERVISRFWRRQQEFHNKESGILNIKTSEEALKADKLGKKSLLEIARFYFVSKKIARKKNVTNVFIER